MSMRIGTLFVLALLLAYPVAAAGAAGNEEGWPTSTKLASIMVKVDPATGLTQAEVVSNGDILEKAYAYGNCTGDVTVDMGPVCPTCDNCATPCDDSDMSCDSPDVNEIVLLSLRYVAPSPYTTMIRPTAGQKYGLELDNIVLQGSASSCTHEIICPQADPSMGYEFGHKMHCAVVLSIDVDNCDSFAVWFDVMGTAG